jgi:hypothetical protein
MLSIRLGNKTAVAKGVSSARTPATPTVNIAMTGKPTHHLIPLVRIALSSSKYTFALSAVGEARCFAVGLPVSGFLGAEGGMKNRRARSS